MCFTATFPIISRLDGSNMTASMTRTTDSTPSSSNGPTRGQSELQSLLDERAKTHGDFNRNAAIAQWLKAFSRQQPEWAGKTDIEKEALDQMASKYARRLSSKNKIPHPDHGLDFDGYDALADGAH